MLTKSTHGAQFAPFDKSGKAKILHRAFDHSGNTMPLDPPPFHVARPGDRITYLLR
jgi:hypothetical protein